LFELGQRLGQRMTRTDAALFLDRLARCEAYDDADKDEAGIREVVERAQSAFTKEEKSVVSLAAGALKLRELDSRSLALLADVRPAEIDPLSWFEDVALVCTVAGFLAPPAKERLVASVEVAFSVLHTAPDKFLPAVDAATDRQVYEEFDTPRLSLLDEFVTDCSNLGLSALELDAFKRSARTEQDPALLQKVLTEARNSGALQRAEEAFADAMGWQAEIIEFVRRERMEHSQVQRVSVLYSRMAAAGSVETPSVFKRLRVFEEGELVLVSEEGEFSVEWWQEGFDLAVEAELEVRGSSDIGLSLRDGPTGVITSWPLPLDFDWSAPPQLTFRLQGEVFTIKLPEVPSEPNIE